MEKCARMNNLMPNLAGQIFAGKGMSGEYCQIFVNPVDVYHRLKMQLPT